MAQQSSTDFVFLVLLGLYLLAVSMISGHDSGNKSEIPCVYEVDGFPQRIRLWERGLTARQRMAIS
jgi:hypothetical protein